MMKGQKGRVEKLTFFEYEKVLRSRKVALAWDTVLCFVVPLFVYWLVLEIIQMFDLLDYQEDLLALGAYIILLFVVAFKILIKKNKAKGNEDVFLSGDELESVFLFVILLATFYFFAVGFGDTLSESKRIGAGSATLFVGFAVSLRKLFESKNMRDVIMCFVNPLINICQVIHIGMLLCGLGFMLGIAYLSVMPESIPIVMKNIFVILIIALILLTVVRNNAKKYFLKNIDNLIDGKSILILQLGPDYIVGKALKQLFAENGVQVTDVSEDILLRDRYQIVIVLNSLQKKKEYLPKIDLLDSHLMSDGYIIDPFITRNHRRAFIDAWFGVPCRKPKLFTFEQYHNIMHNNRNRVKRTNKNPLIPVLVATGISLVFAPIVTYLVAIFVQNTQLLPEIGGVDSWIAFAGSILGGSLTMLALVFTLYYERRATEKSELQRIRPTLFCSINKELFADDYCEIYLPNCTNNYDFIRWRIKNASESIANHIRIIEERTYIKNNEALKEIDSDTLLNLYGISIMTVSLQDYIALEPHGVGQCRTNFCLETDTNGKFKINSAFDFLNAITIEYTDVKGVGVYRSKFTLHVNINLDVENKPHIFIERVDTTLLEV